MPMQQTRPIPLTPEAKRENARYLQVYEANLEQLKVVSLSILVWGPGPNRDSPIAEKRKDIRDELLLRGHNAMFSEDIPTRKNGLSQKSKEFAQAQAADLIIILVEDSAGALGEAHDFCNDPNLAPKTCVMVPRHYRKGYSGQGAFKDLEEAYGGIFWYGEGDIAICKVLTRAVRRAEALRNIRLRARTA
jgi:hypothetical protein